MAFGDAEILTGSAARSLLEPFLHRACYPDTVPYYRSTAHYRFPVLLHCRDTVHHRKTAKQHHIAKP